MSGSNRYKKNPPGGSMISVVAKIFYEAIFAGSTKGTGGDSEKLLANVVESGGSSQNASNDGGRGTNTTGGLFVLPAHWLDR
jgi:hypothetical protein